VRPFAPADIPQVARLYHRTFLEPNSAAASQVSVEAIESCLESAFFDNPWRTPDLPSLVYQDNRGRVSGFVGVTPREMVFEDRPVRVAVSLHLMVRRESRATLAGIELMKTLFSGPQDLLMTDGAGDHGRKLWEGLGGVTALPYSISWVRLLRPGAYLAKHLASKSRLLEALTFASKPIQLAADSALARLMPHRFGTCRPELKECEIDDERLLHCLASLTRRFSLRPRYDLRSIGWLLGMADRLSQHGRLSRIELRDDSDQTIGCYLMHHKPRGVARVLRMEARRGSAGAVLDSLFYRAREEGAIAVEGRIGPGFVRELSDSSIMSFGRPWVLVHSRNPELLNAVHRGDAALARLDGEWCLQLGKSESQPGRL
jgi:hypothetical protein